MTLLTEPTRIVLAKGQPFPAVLGEPFGGGFFAGYISHTADGNPTHALIVAPRATGATGSSYTLTTNLQWKTTQTTTVGTTSPFDGAANTAAMVTAGIADHPAANFCVGLSIGGLSDWYLPARYELDIAYFNLKPNTALNNVSATLGINPYSVPKREAPRTASYPAQTYSSAFIASGSEFFSVGTYHWASTEGSQPNGWMMWFSNGDFTAGTGTAKTNLVSVRAFRRIAL